MKSKQPERRKGSRPPGKGSWQQAYKDGQEEGEGKAVSSHAHSGIVGSKEQGYEDNHVEACQRSDALWRPAHNCSTW